MLVLCIQHHRSPLEAGVKSDLRALIEDGHWCVCSEPE
jgi:hypothetical protein